MNQQQVTNQIKQKQRTQKKQKENRREEQTSMISGSINQLDRKRNLV